MSNRLVDKVCVITGTGGSMGRATALAFVREGALGVAMTSELLIALFVGLSVPVIGAGIALDEGASAPDTVLVFAILVALGVSASGWALLGHRSKGSFPD